MSEPAENAAAWDAPVPNPPPPAPPAPPASSSPAARGVGEGLVEAWRSVLAAIDGFVKTSALPFDSARSAVEWWYRPLVERAGWVALGSLFVGVVWSVIVFALAATVFFITFGLAFTGIGLVLVIPASSALDALARIERARAGWVGDAIPPPQFVPTGTSVWSMIASRLGDAARWRQVLFFGLFVVAGPVLFALGILPWAVLAQLIVGNGFDAFNPVGLLVAAVLAGGAPRITIGIARLGGAFTASLLGPSETAELQERVTELSEQREHILDAVAGERRRIERNLHDGVQQQLVALGIDIGRARARIENDPEGSLELLDAARDKVRGSIGELRSIGRGLHPAVLEDRGLDAALSAVVADAPIPISVEIATREALPEEVAATAYYVVNEAVANILKHAGARVASIRVFDDPSVARAVRLSIHDDGRGGADIGTGTGLAGMRARVEGMDGHLRIDSPSGGPTTIVAVLPLDGARHDG